jgi:hypothetical protein
MGLIFIAYIVVSGSVGSLSGGPRIAIAVICAAVALYAFPRPVMCRTMHGIHISGTGQIRLSIWQKNDRLGRDGLADGQGELVRLLPTSTLWSGLLLLHLQNERRQVDIVTILPDSVSRESFRALLIACRWIVLRHADADADIDNQRIGES